MSFKTAAGNFAVWRAILSMFPPEAGAISILRFWQTWAGVSRMGGMPLK